MPVLVAVTVAIMIRFSVLYPSGDGTFDHDYFRATHVPLCEKSWGIGGSLIDQGLSGPYVAAVHFSFPSQDAMNDAMATPGTTDVLNDMANYTTISPVMQVSETN